MSSSWYIYVCVCAHKYSGLFSSEKRRRKRDWSALYSILHAAHSVHIVYSAFTHLFSSSFLLLLLILILETLCLYRLLLSFLLLLPVLEGKRWRTNSEELSRYNYSASHWCSGYWIVSCQVKPLLSLIKDRNDNKFVMLNGPGFITSRGNLMNFLLEERLGNHLNPRMVEMVPWRPDRFH